MNLSQQSPSALAVDRPSGWWEAPRFGQGTALGIGFSILFWLSAELGRSLLFSDGPYVTFWLPAGLYLGALLLTGRRAWPFLIAGAGLGNFLFDARQQTPLGIIPWFFIANTAQALTGAIWTQKAIGRQVGIRHLPDFLVIVGIGVVAAPMVGASIAVPGLMAFHMTADPAQAWQIWWGGNAMAILILLPFALAWRPNQEVSWRLSLSPSQIGELSLLALLLVVSTFLVLSHREGVGVPYKARIYPLLLWAGLRFGLRGATLANVALALLTGALLTQFSQKTGTGRDVLVSQTFLTVGAIVSLVPAVVLHERDRTLRALRQSEERYRTVVEFSPEAIAISVDERLTYLNPAGAALVGAQDTRALLGRSVFDFVPAELHETMRSRRASVLERGVAASVTDLELIRLDGSRLSVESMAVPFSYEGRPAIMNLMRDITHRRVAEEALRESAQRFQGVFNSAYELMGVLSVDGILWEVNQTALALVGARREEVVGKAFWDTPWWSHSAELQERLKVGVRMAARGEVYRAEAEHPTHDGRFVVVEFSLKPVFDDDGKVVMLIPEGHDITDRVRAEQKLQENQRVLATLLSNLPGMLYRCKIDAEWSMEFVSEGARGLTGYLPDQLLRDPRTSFGKLIHPDDRDRISEEIRRAVDSRKQFELIYRIRTSTNEERWVMERGQAILAESGEPVSVEGFVTDITLHHRAELERREAVERERQAREEYTRLLITSQEAERRRIAGELHDSLGQNLLMIQNRVQLALAAGVPPGGVRDQLNAIGEIVQGSVAEVRQISHDLRPYQLDHLGLTRALRTMLENTARSSGLGLESHLELVDDLFSPDEATSLYRIVQESLNNILKHARASKVEVRLERDLHQVTLAIQDNGIGFVSAAERGEVPPAGLGLRNIAERTGILGGTVEVTSQPGRGTLVQVVVPLKSSRETTVPMEGHQA